MHVTIRLLDGLPTLRSRAVLAVLHGAFARGAERFGSRLVQYSIQSTHVHLIVEARDQRALSRGMQGLQIRIARALNRVWKRTGKLFADRFHAHVLRTPREVRNALVYVLQNARKHGRGAADIDPFSSGLWFDGWSEAIEVVGSLPDWFRKVVVDARSWLLAVGWRTHGLLRCEEAPVSSRVR